MTLPPVIRRSISARVVFSVLITLASINAQAASKQLACSPSSIRFGQIVIGQSQSETVDLTNTGQTSITVTSVTVNQAQYTVSGLPKLPLTLAAGQTVTGKVTFTPTVDQWVGGTVTFTASASNQSIKLSLAGTGTSSLPITAVPATVSFGQVAVGSTATSSVTLTNNRSWNISLTSDQISGNGFSATGLSFPMTLKAGQSVKFNISFAPQSSGLAGGSVFLIGGGTNVPLSGTGTITSVGQLNLAPSSLNFGSVDVGSTGTQSLAMGATGGNVVVSSGSSSNAEFSIPGASFPLTITSGQTVSVNVTFAPTKSGSASGTLTFTSNASDSTATDATSGTGVTPTYSVSLTWNASNSVVGYNVYRGATSSGPFTKMNSTLDPLTSYTDSTVASGATYYYVATSVNSSGQESGYSTPAEAVIP